MASNSHTNLNHEKSVPFSGITNNGLAQCKTLALALERSFVVIVWLFSRFIIKFNGCRCLSLLLSFRGFFVWDRQITSSTSHHITSLCYVAQTVGFSLIKLTKICSFVTWVNIFLSPCFFATFAVFLCKIRCDFRDFLNEKPNIVNHRLVKWSPFFCWMKSSENAPFCRLIAHANSLSK